MLVVAALATILLGCSGPTSDEESRPCRGMAIRVDLLRETVEDTIGKVDAALEQRLAASEYGEFVVNLAQEIDEFERW